MEQERWSFTHDENNRIQKLYYDVNINTTFNKTKLQNVKNKFIKYGGRPTVFGDVLAGR